MHLKAFASLLSLAAVVAGYIVPADLADGLYLVPLDSDNPTPQRIDLPNFRVPKTHVPRSAKFTRHQQLQKRLEWAATGHTFPNHDDYNACTEGWKVFWANGNSVPGHFLFLCTVGEAVLAGCNYTREYPPNLPTSLTYRATYLGYPIRPAANKNDENLPAGDEFLEPESVDEFNGIADAQFGFWNTGWVHSNPFHAGIPNGDWTYWRDIRGTQFCTNLP